MLLFVSPKQVFLADLERLFIASLLANIDDKKHIIMTGAIAGLKGVFAVYKPRGIASAKAVAKIKRIVTDGLLQLLTVNANLLSLDFVLF